MQATVSIVIVSYNVSGLLRKCLDSVLAEQADTELIVVDNASSDDSVEMVRTHFPSVKLIANTTNAGFSGANNQGMKLARGNFIFLLNPDTELKAGALKTMLDFAKTQSNLFLLGPQLLNSDGSLQVSTWKKPGAWNTIAEALFLHRLFRVSEYPEAKFSKPFSPGMISGAAMFFPRELFEKTGGLDPELFWMEDADFSYRATQLGASVLYFPSAQVLHHSGQSSKKNLNVAISNQLLSKLKYLRKHAGGFASASAVFFCGLQIISRIILFTLLSLFSGSIRQKAIAYRYSFTKYRRYVFGGDKSLT